MIRKRAKRLAGAVLAAGTITAMPFQAFAQRSPEFAYSAEKWATLRDNKLEFDEISDLVHEYNPTVVQNEISYKDYLTKNRDDVAQDYYDKANEIYSNISYPDSDDANYGSGVAAALRNEQQAKSLMEQGDENTDDKATMRIQYDQAEAKLAKQAQAALLDAKQALPKGQLDLAAIALRQAYGFLGRLFGREADERVIDRIFEKFCLGK